ncbi:IscS subfamily cysteine desulfurase [Chitinophaga arvensicola]|uniref:Cysteine desulfurase IscS n=1 Tax=Chitinophaga arvensicola TaxID=29529 RepID=A0A1I0Q5V5_9BACT|nr:IscS subfamily cysteine desulfurase [Chitinophaga arvensicola]SEW22314.1 cysteine desulfurase IscS [Chitinophaga arvensicola]
MLQLPVYLDNNATTPCDPRVVAAMLPYFTETFGNAASRSHPFGWAAEEAVDYAREQVARLIGAEPKEMVFTSGATEAVNLALKGVYEMYAGKGNHIITALTEHKAVLDTCRHLEKMGARITWLPVNAEGLIDLQELEAAITPQTILISLMYANNETGVIYPVQAISEIARKHDVLFMSDATQAVGKVPVDVNNDGIDLLTLSAHKLYGPKGAGALYVRRRSPRVRLTAQIDGGGHERGMRSGTLNVPGIVGLGKAAELCMEEMTTDTARILPLRNQLEQALLELELSFLNGSRQHRLPHTCNLSFKYVESEALMMGFNKKIALSSGSACTSASLEPSHVLKAMGLSDELAYASLRFGLGRFTTAGQIAFTIRTITEAVTQLRNTSPIWEMYKDGVDLG